MSTILLIATPLSLATSFGRVISALRARGHAVRVATEGDGSCPARRSDDWKDSIAALRGCRDYSRYLHEPLRNGSKVRKRALLSVIASVSAGARRRIEARCPSCDSPLKGDDVASLAFGLDARGLEAVEALFRLAEDAVPSDPGYEAFLRSERPDAVIVTPLTRFGSGQPDVVKSCRALGIPVALAVPALDTLSAHGLLHVHPDRVFVWNDRQLQEAVDLQQIAADRVTITGAARFDAFCERRPAQSREDFCAQHAIDPGKPILTYLCSSDFVHRDEAAFVATWIDRIRRDMPLRECGIIIRPHPRARRTWSAVDVRQWDRVAFIPTTGGDPLPSLHSALWHADAVAALNTTAEIEAGLLGKPVFTIVTRTSAHAQTGTLYYRYLLRQHGGYVAEAHDFDAHKRQLAAAVAGNADRDDIRSCAAGFVRMGVIDAPASPRMADAIEDLMRPVRAMRRVR